MLFPRGTVNDMLSILFSKELVLINSTATSVSVTLGILAMIAMLRSTNASLRPVFAVGKFAICFLGIGRVIKYDKIIYSLQ